MNANFSFVIFVIMLRQCCHSAPPCLRACPTCPCRKRIFLGTRVKRQNGLDNLLGLHCLPCPAAINDGEPEVKAKKPKNTARDVVEEALKAAKVKLFSNSIQNAKRCVKRDGEVVFLIASTFQKFAKNRV
uniref:Uncharacterized protein n=1 Tax=Acrobeloides nanus TaxID=290746 RepID=A0A914DQN6_9BILA